MAEQTGISWTDATFNPWIGCTKVGPGCDHCYAEADFDLRRHRVKWGSGNPRSRTSAANWQNPVRWNRQHDAFFAEHGRRRRVFCASLADVFDNEVSPMWRRDLFRLIAETPNLDWLLLTKRIGNVWPMMLEVARLCCGGEQPLPNIWLGATMVTRAEFLRDLDKLRNVPARIRFVSAEPLLEDIGDVDLRGIDWLIVGGESGAQARPMDASWVRRIRAQCDRDGVAFHFKQWGGRSDKGGCELDGHEAKAWPVSHAA